MVCPVQAVPAAEEPRAAWHRPAALNTNLLDFDLDGLAAYCEQLGEKRFRATQLFRWIHQRGAGDFDQRRDRAKSLAPRWWIQRNSCVARKRFSPSCSQ